MSKRTSMFHNFSLAFLLTLPAAVLTGLGAVFTYEMWEEFRNHELGYVEQVHQHTRWMQFLKDGTPIVRVTDYSAGGGTYSGGQTEYWESLDGKRLDEVDRNDFLWGHQPQIRLVQTVVPLSIDPFEYQFRQGVDGFDVIQDPFDTRRTWRSAFGKADSRYFECRGSNGMVFEYCGRSGFTPNRPSADVWFQNPVDFRVRGEIIAFRSDGELIGINLRKRVVVPFSKLDDDQAWTFFESEAHGSGIMIVRDQSLAWFDLQGQVILRSEMPEGVQGEIAFMFKADGSLMVRSSELESRDPGRRGTQSSTGLQVAYWLDESGAVIRTQEFQGESRTTRTFDAPAIVTLFENFCSDAAPGLVLPSPGVLAVFHYAAVPLVYQSRLPGGSYTNTRFQKPSPCGRTACTPRCSLRPSLPGTASGDSADTRPRGRRCGSCLCSFSESPAGSAGACIAAGRRSP